MKIAERLTPGDFLRFRSVCTAWASAITVGGYSPLRNFIPWLMLSDNPYSFFSIPDSLSYHYPSDVRCIECISAQNGWLAIVHGVSKYCLINPITRSQINLPPVSRNFHVRKIVLSSTPSANISSSCIIVAMYGVLYYSLAFSRAGSTSWTSIRLTHGMEKGIEDVVYHDGNFFVISTRGQVQALDLSGHCPMVLSFVNNYAEVEVEQRGYLWTRYLVSSFGDLLLVRKQRDYVRNRRFIIMKFNPMIDSCWEEITDLGTRSLFLDNKNLTSISASEITGHKGNCIYFINEHMDFHDNYVCDVEIFDIESGTIQPCFRPELQFICSLQLPPIWFMPSLS
ncbi:putative F-box protein At4g22170 [Asparagus officinalis]|nr:putative F-box protein At4g22170 [Asparagus officinalis]